MQAVKPVNAQRFGSNSIDFKIPDCTSPLNMTYRNVNDCIATIQRYLDMQSAACQASTNAAATFAVVLAKTKYFTLAAQIHVAMRQMEDITSGELQRMQQGLASHWSNSKIFTSAGVVAGTDRESHDSVNNDIEVIVNSLMTFMQSQFALFKSLTRHLARFMESGYVPNHLVSSTTLNPPSTAPLHPAVSATRQQGSPPSTARSSSPGLDSKEPLSPVKLTSNLFSQIVKNKPTDSQAFFYAPLEEGSAAMLLSDSGGQQGSTINQTSVVGHDAVQLTSSKDAAISTTSAPAVLGKELSPVKSNGGRCVTQEELDAVINILSSGHRQITHPPNLPVKLVDTISDHLLQPRISVTHSSQSPSTFDMAQVISLLRNWPQSTGLERPSTQNAFHSDTDPRRLVQRPSVSNSQPGSRGVRQSEPVGTTTWPPQSFDQSRWSTNDSLAVRNIYGFDVCSSCTSSSSLLLSTSQNLTGCESSAIMTWPAVGKNLGLETAGDGKSDGRSGRSVAPGVDGGGEARSRRLDKDGEVVISALQQLYGSSVWSVGDRTSSTSQLSSADTWKPSLWNTACSDSGNAASAAAATTAAAAATVNSFSGCRYEGTSNTADSHWSQSSHRRRHSSGESSAISSSVQNTATAAATPPPWVSDPRYSALLSGPVAAGGPSRVSGGGGHRALTMQWSDPLASGLSLSCWDNSNQPAWGGPQSMKLGKTSSQSKPGSRDHFNKHNF